METDLHLETDWNSDPTHCDCLADVVIYDPNDKRHLIRTSISRKFLTLEGHLTPDAIACTIVGGKVLKSRLGLHVCVPTSDAQAHLLSHKLPSGDCMHNAIELCSGIGALGEGLEHNGFTIRVRNELRQAYVNLMQRQGFRSTVLGDVGSNQVISQIHHACPESGLHAAGFPCQPWSMLGDRQKTQDARGLTLQAILRTAFMLRAHSLLLECVTQASDDIEVHKLLYRWCKCTGFNARECKLELHNVWPCRRSRWWVLLTFPGSSPVDLQPLPRMHPMPVVADVVPTFPTWPQDQTKQLVLDSYE